MTTPALPFGDSKEIANLFGNIAPLAEQIRDVLSNALEDGDINQTGWLIVAAQSLAAQVGFLADLGAARAGGVQLRGDATDWFTPRTSRAPAEDVSEGVPS